MAKPTWTRLYSDELFKDDYCIILAELLRSPSDATFFSVRRYEPKRGWLRPTTDGVLLRMEEMVQLHKLTNGFENWTSDITDKLDEHQDFPKILERDNYRHLKVHVTETGNVTFILTKRYQGEMTRATITVKIEWIRHMFKVEYTVWDCIASLWPDYLNGKDAEIHENAMGAVVAYHVTKVKKGDELVPYLGQMLPRSQQDKHELLLAHPPVFDYRLVAGLFPLLDFRDPLFKPIEEVVNTIAMRYIVDVPFQTEWGFQQRILKLATKIMDYRYNKALSGPEAKSCYGW